MGERVCCGVNAARACSTVETLKRARESRKYSRKALKLIQSTVIGAGQHWVRNMDTRREMLTGEVIFIIRYYGL